jgi:hypothetical protein
MTLKSQTFWVSMHQGDERENGNSIKLFDAQITECLRHRPKWTRELIKITSAGAEGFIVTTVIYDEQVRESWKREHPDEDKPDPREALK